MIVEGTQNHEWLGGPVMTIILGIALVGCLVAILAIRSKEGPTYLVGGLVFAAVGLVVLLVGSGLYAVYGDHDHFTVTETGKRYYPASVSSQREALNDYYNVRYEWHRYTPSLYLSDGGKYYYVCEATISKVDSKHFKVEAECDGKTLPVPKSKN